MEQAKPCAVWPMENWLGSSMNHMYDCLRTLQACFRIRMSGDNEPLTDIALDALSDWIGVHVLFIGFS